MGSRKYESIGADARVGLHYTVGDRTMKEHGDLPKVGDHQGEPLAGPVFQEDRSSEQPLATAISATRAVGVAIPTSSKSFKAAP